MGCGARCRTGRKMQWTVSLERDVLVWGEVHPVWFSWQCSATCGGGVQERVVICQLPSGLSLPDHSCESVHRPGHSQRCNRHHCRHPVTAVSAVYEWQRGPWGQVRQGWAKGMLDVEFFCIVSSCVSKISANIRRHHMGNIFTHGMRLCLHYFGWYIENGLKYIEIISMA